MSAKTFSSKSIWKPHTIFLFVLLPQMVAAQCVGIAEEGRWHNLDNTGEPIVLDIKMSGGCGDQVLNGQQTASSPHYSLRAWVKQSSGQLYGRPVVSASYRLWKNKRWLQGNVPTGGYVDEIWARVEDHAGNPNYTCSSSTDR